jgi:cytochrome c2
MTLKTDQKYADGDLFAANADKAKLQQAAQKGKEVIAKYGCFGCHDIKGFENAQKIGTELTEHGRKDAHLLDFGDVRYFTANPKERETYANWVWMKLDKPRIYAYERVETRMPQFDFSDDEKLAILTFLKGQTGEKPPPPYLTATDPNKAAIHQGERLVFWNGCRNCHIVEKRGGTIRDRFNEDDQSYAPPILNGEGWKVQPQWLFSFLKDPVGPATEGKNLRPWVKIRMPTFHFTDDEATNLVKYFAAASGKSYPYLTPREGEKPTPEHLAEANALFEELKCMSCHVVGEMRPGQDPGSAAPNLLLAKSRLRPDWIPAWLQNPQALMDGTRMPSFWDFADPKKPVAPSKTFHGDAKAQVDALRDLLMYLGDEKQQGPKRAETEQPKPRKRG